MMKDNQISNFMERFWSKVDKSSEGCWTWMGAHKPSGYGNVTYCYKVYSAHRMAYELTFGSIPHGQFVLHHCDNPRCVNPSHLFLGTTVDNARDMLAKGREGNSKLDFAKATEIRRLYSLGGIFQKELADLFGVHYSTISNIVKHKVWR